jgi:hypothetical protein
LSEKELLEKYAALLYEQKMYVSGAIAALISLRGDPTAGRLIIAKAGTGRLHSPSPRGALHP